MWNYKTIMNLWLHLVKQKYDFIVNIGVCWWANNNLSPNPLPFSQKEGKEKIIQISGIKNISNNKELISPIFLEFTKIKSIACSEKIIFDSNLLKGEKFVDMESYWFEMICDKFNIPRIILKIPVDKIWEETKKFDFWKAKIYLKENINYSELLENIKKYLKQTLPELSHLEEKEYKVKNEILNLYKWTFTEKIIIEKEINRFLVLELWNLDNFLKENRELEKKEFFKKLKNIN
jgi:hypothetical protein